MISHSPDKATVFWGSKGVLQQEVKYRTGIRSRKSYLFWLVAFLVFLVILALL